MPIESVTDATAVAPSIDERSIDESRAPINEADSQPARAAEEQVSFRDSVQQSQYTGKGSVIDDIA